MSIKHLWCYVDFMNKFIVALVALITSTFAVGLASAPASATENTKNQVSDWCANGGVKYEPVATPFVVPAPPEGKVWTLLVIKAGSGEGENTVVNNPVVGQAYYNTTNLNENNGGYRDISHVILCYGTQEQETTTTVAETTTTVADETTTTVANGDTTTTATPVVPVVPVVPATPTPAAPATPQVVTDLPHTGNSSGTITLFAAILVLMGAGATALARRKSTII